MRVLLIKMSSMGDVLHTLPALTDAQKALPEIQFDWIVETAFSEIPSWHPAVKNVVPIALRQWRKQPWSPQVWRAWREFFAQVCAHGPYDLILDAQGLLKSAFVAKKAQKALKKVSFSVAQKKALEKIGETPLVYGLDKRSARESLATWFYDQTVHVPTEQHAIVRLRQLFAQVLNYPDSRDMPISYGVQLPAQTMQLPVRKPYWVMLHGTTWETKLWPEAYWRELIEHAITAGKQVVLPWGTEEEKARSLRLAEGIPDVWVPDDRLPLNAMAELLKEAEQVVAVDTGLAHLAAALEVPTLVLYRVTDPERVGACGINVRHLVSPVASQYIKRFSSPEQEQLSLQNLQVEDVIECLNYLLFL